jgi:hypothetical protein
MKRALLVLALVALVCTGCSIIRAQPTPQTKSGTLQGVVTGPSGPIGNAQVSVTASDATLHTGVTNADGFYSISGIPEGPATFTIQAAGFAQFSGTTNIQADPANNRQDASLNPQ